MIPDPPAIGVYVLAALALLIVPGPSVLYIVARSITTGAALASSPCSASTSARSSM